MPPKRKKKRRRRSFSLNGLAIQLSAFALSFTLVALLVVSGSQQAFVEENEAVTDYVPIGTDGSRRRGGARPRTPAAVPATDRRRRRRRPRPDADAGGPGRGAEHGRSG